MKCPHCGYDEDKVLDTRVTDTGTAIRRRRECIRCGFRFTSYERIEEKTLYVIKKSGAREPFDIDKLDRSIRIATTKRSLGDGSFSQFLKNIEGQILIAAGSEREISSAEIGEIILSELYKVDPVAFIRFASVYRSYTSIDQFIEEIDTLRHQSE